MTTLTDIREYARGTLNCGGILAHREPDGAMTQNGVPVASIKLTIVGLDENELATTIVANLTRQQTSELADRLVGLLLDD